MYLGDEWITVDGKTLFEHFTTTKVILSQMDKWAAKTPVIDDPRYLSKKRQWSKTTSFHKIVFRNSDRAINFWKENQDAKPCNSCRGFGYIRRKEVEIWNGRPYLVASPRDTLSIDWKNPAWCESCDGYGGE